MSLQRPAPRHAVVSSPRTQRHAVVSSPRAQNPAQARAANRKVLVPAVLMTAGCISFGGLAASAAASSPVASVAPVAVAAPLDVQLAPTRLADLPSGRDRIAQAPEPVAAPAPPPRRRAPVRASRTRRTAVPKTTTVARRIAVPTATWVIPNSGRLTSAYGPRWGRLHGGLDLASGVGSPNRAAAAGVVLRAGVMSGYGNAVDIQHSNGVVTRYAHNSTLLVSTGQRVRAGQPIGREGSSGNVTGPHLHFEVRINDSPVDPRAFLRSKGVRI